MTTTVPVYADQEFKDALRELAYRRRTSMSRLVRAALEDALGDELKACFFADSVALKQHKKRKDNKEQS